MSFYSVMVAGERGGRSSEDSQTEQAVESVSSWDTDSVRLGVPEVTAHSSGTAVTGT